MSRRTLYAIGEVALIGTLLWGGIRGCDFVSKRVSLYNSVNRIKKLTDSIDRINTMDEARRMTSALKEERESLRDTGLFKGILYYEGK
jgi:hypothetical protein